MSKRSWVYIDGKAYEKGVDIIPEDRPKGPLVIGDIEPFVSPITKEVIKGRNHLRRHMKEHGVTHSSDYSPEWYQKKQRENRLRALGQDKQSRSERIELIKQQLER